MSGKIRFLDPPAEGIRARGQEIDRLVTDLRGRPGEWALVAENVTASARRSWRRRGCETRLSTVDESIQRYDVYARWPR